MKKLALLITVSLMSFTTFAKDSIEQCIQMERELPICQVKERYNNSVLIGYRLMKNTEEIKEYETSEEATAAGLKLEKFGVCVLID